MWVDREIFAQVIMEDVVLEAKEILQKAEKQAASIRDESKNQEKKIRQQGENDQSLMEAFLAKSRMISQAEIKSRMEIINLEESILKEIIGSIKEEFFSLPKEASYPSLLLKLIIKGLGFLEGERFLCQVNEQDRLLLSPDCLKEIGLKIGKEVSLDQRSIPIKGGVIMVRDDGRVLYDNSLEGIFERQYEKIRSLGALYLFERGLT